jgi:hypothetical protein
MKAYRLVSEGEHFIVEAPSFGEALAAFRSSNRREDTSPTETDEEKDLFWAEYEPESLELLSEEAVIRKDAPTVDILFDGPPGPEAGRFVEVERDGKSVRLGEWVERGDGYWALRVPVDGAALAKAGVA